MGLNHVSNIIKKVFLDYIMMKKIEKKLFIFDELKVWAGVNPIIEIRVSKKD